MGAPDPAFAEFRREQLEIFDKPKYTVRSLAKKAKLSRWLIDNAIKQGRLRAYQYGSAENAHWLVECEDWIKFRWASSSMHPAEPVEPPQSIARPQRGGPRVSARKQPPRWASR